MGSPNKTVNMHIQRMPLGIYAIAVHPQAGATRRSKLVLLKSFVGQKSQELKSSGAGQLLDVGCVDSLAIPRFRRKFPELVLEGNNYFEGLQIFMALGFSEGVDLPPPAKFQNTYFQNFGGWTLVQSIVFHTPNPISNIF